MGEADSRANHPFAEFARRFASAGHDLPAPVARIANTSLDAIERRASSGALFARTSWWEHGANSTGCLLWIGAGEAPAEQLDQTLRRRVAAGGEGELGLEWSQLAPLGPGEVGDVLRHVGVPRACKVREFHLGPMTFLFLSTEPEPAVSDEHPPGDESPGSLDHLLSVRLPLTIRLGSTRMNLDDVLRLTPGSVVELDQREDQPLEVLANGHVVARGEVVVVDERFGLRITKVGRGA